MALLAAVCAVVGTLLAGYWWRSRQASSTPSRRASVYVVLHDGSSSWLYDAERLPTGSFRVAGAEYPAAVARLVDDVAGFGAPLYIVAVEPLALTKHRELEQYRTHIIKGAIFKSGGDLMELLRIGAAAAVIACALFVYMSVSALSGQFAAQEASLKAIEAWTNSPKVVVPLSGETP